MRTIHDEERAFHRPKLQEDGARRDGHFSVRRYEPHRSTATVRFVYAEGAGAGEKLVWCKYGIGEVSGGRPVWRGRDGVRVG